MSKKIIVACVCPFCGKTTELAVDCNALSDYRCGAVLVQEAFPTLTTTERELIKTGMCPECQNSVFDTSDGVDGELWEDEFEDDDLEMGFDPYEGCYSFDC